jgi:hypothetical protein
LAAIAGKKKRHMSGNIVGLLWIFFYLDYFLIFCSCFKGGPNKKDKKNRSLTSEHAFVKRKKA